MEVYINLTVMEVYISLTVMEVYINLTVMEVYINLTVMEVYINLTVMEVYINLTVMEVYINLTVMEVYINLTVMEVYINLTVMEVYINLTVMEVCINLNAPAKDLNQSWAHILMSTRKNISIFFSYFFMIIITDSFSVEYAYNLHQSCANIFSSYSQKCQASYSPILLLLLDYLQCRSFQCQEGGLTHFYAEVNQ